MYCNFELVYNTLPVLSHIGPQASPSPLCVLIVFQMCSVGNEETNFLLSLPSADALMGNRPKQELKYIHLTLH